MLKDDDKIILEEKALFSQSIIWDLQNSYYNSKGIDAWNIYGVPFHITSNSSIGKTYAEIAIAFMEDMAKTSLDTVYFLELGAGHGRFSFYFLLYFLDLYRQSDIPLPDFRYIISDLAENNIRFYQNHPKIKPCIDSGIVDTCLFDITNSKNIVLGNSGIILERGSTAQPLVVIANYVFDTIPQELYYIDNKDIYNCFVSTSINEDNYIENIRPAPEQLFLKYDYEKISEFSGVPRFVIELLDYYKESLTNSHLLFPVEALKCLERLRQISRKGLMLLTSDKGNQHLYAEESAPIPVPHGVINKSNPKGAFSFSVNYHIFKEYFKKNKGITLFPSLGHKSILTGCFIIANDILQFNRTMNAYNNCVKYASPDAISSITESLLEKCEGMQDALYLLGLNHYDPMIFSRLLPYIYSIQNFSTEQRTSLFNIVPKIWEQHYPISDDHDLAHELGSLLFHLGYFEEAILYLKLSPFAHEENISQDILFCYYKLKKYDKAIELLEALKHS